MTEEIIAPTLIVPRNSYKFNDIMKNNTIIDNESFTCSSIISPYQTEMLTKRDNSISQPMVDISGQPIVDTSSQPMADTPIQPIASTPIQPATIIKSTKIRYKHSGPFAKCKNKPSKEEQSKKLFSEIEEIQNKLAEIAYEVQDFKITHKKAMDDLKNRIDNVSSLCVLNEDQTKVVSLQDIDKMKEYIYNTQIIKDIADIKELLQNTIYKNYKELYSRVKLIAECIVDEIMSKNVDDTQELTSKIENIILINITKL